MESTKNTMQAMRQATPSKPTGSGNRTSAPMTPTKQRSSIPLTSFNSAVLHSDLKLWHELRSPTLETRKGKSKLQGCGLPNKWYVLPRGPYRVSELMCILTGFWANRQTMLTMIRKMWADPSERNPAAASAFGISASRSASKRIRSQA